MTRTQNLNFIPRRNNLRLLQTATFASVLGCIALGSSLLWGGAGEGTATISDTIASASSVTRVSPSPNAVKPKAVSEQEIVSAAPGTSADTVRYYERDSGKAFSITLSTQRTEVLSDKRLAGFIRSFWLPNIEAVISAFQKASGVEYRYYDYSTSATTVLGSDFSSVAVSPDGRSVALLDGKDDDTYSLDVAGADGSDRRSVLTTRVQEPQLAWRTADSLSLISRRTDRPGYDLSLVDMKGVLTQVLSNKENLDIAWSPDGKYLLYSYFSSESGTALWLRDISSGAEAPLGLSTSAGKCSWHRSSTAITCGVPMQSSLSRDVPADQTATIDDIFTYDLYNNVLEKIYSGVKGTLIGVTEPLVSSSGEYLVFTNMFDGRLYLLPL